MPRLSTFYGIVIYMYVRDHGVPHFHAWYGDERASVAIVDGRVLEGGLPPRQLRQVRDWLNLHEGELRSAWDRVSRGTPPGTIDPLP
jgi:Domain of unknown function (DUF4160)